MTAIAPAPIPLPPSESETPSTPIQRPTLLSLAMKRRQQLEETDPLELIRERILLQRHMEPEARMITPDDPRARPNMPGTPQTPHTPATPQEPKDAPEDTSHPASPAPAPESADSEAKEPANES
ncbi:unnamed protein product, partial [Dibothriocephalus latus]